MGLERLVIPCFAALAACTSIHPDLRYVEDATHVRTADVATDVDPSVPREAKDLLAKPLDADAAVRIALLDNRELRATLREMGVARGQLVQASVLPNPVVEVEALPERTSNFELRAEYDVTGLVLAPIRARAAAPELDAARYRAAAAVVDTGFHARAAYFRALAAREKLALANRSLDALAAARDAADALFRAGNVSELDFATQDAAYQEARASTAEMELAAADAREALVRALGLHGVDTTFSFAKSQPSVPESLAAADDLETRVLRASFDLKARKSHLEALGRQAGLSRAEGWLPDVAADVHALQGERDPTTGAVTSSAWAVSGGVRLSVPIFDRKQGTSAVLDSEVGAGLERYVGAAADLRSRTRAAYARLVTAHAKAKQYERVIVPARRRVVDQALLQYNAMQMSFFQLLALKREQLASELAAVDAVCNYRIARAAFDALLSGGDTDDLPANKPSAATTGVSGGE